MGADVKLKMILLCSCGKQGESVKDEKLEAKGYYSFKCKCGEEYIAPMDNPDIVIIEDNKIVVKE